LLLPPSKPLSTKSKQVQGSRAAELMNLLAIGWAPPLPSFAVPHKRRRLLIPPPRSLLKPASDFRGAVDLL
jgi:hypothetical protein